MCERFLVSVCLSLRPDPRVRAQNELLLKATYLNSEWDDSEADVEDWDSCPVSYADRLEGARFLLDMDTGDWSQDEIVHHCSIGCCQNAAESRLKLWVAIQAGFATP